MTATLRDDRDDLLAATPSVSITARDGADL